VITRTFFKTIVRANRFLVETNLAFFNPSLQNRIPFRISAFGLLSAFGPSDFGIRPRVPVGVTVER
jgi:hypothetical protein